jgi:hypothetical protein
MRYYTIDELTRTDTSSLSKRLDDMGLRSDIEGLYWLPCPQALLAAVQQEHAASCGAHVMALEVLPDTLNLELLVRARNKMRCECVQYASPALAQHMITYLDALLEELGVHI